jgi:hypothetical protein
MGLNVDLALEMLCLCDLAERYRGAQFGALDELEEPTSSFLNLKSGNPAKPVRVRDSPIRAPKGLVASTGRADTECFVARSDAGDVVVAFRSSEWPPFGKQGQFKDWFLTDLQSTRMHYPPAPGSTGNRRWVHSGFWHAYEPLSKRLLAEVARQADRGGANAPSTSQASRSAARWRCWRRSTSPTRCARRTCTSSPSPRRAPATRRSPRWWKSARRAPAASAFAATRRCTCRRSGRTCR